MATLKLRTPLARRPSPGQVGVEHYWARVRRTRRIWERTLPPAPTTGPEFTPLFPGQVES